LDGVADVWIGVRSGDSCKMMSSEKINQNDVVENTWDIVINSLSNVISWLQRTHNAIAHH
jgi:hypothetical protein